jgi:MFS superfamily sulfate permease-like transporter
MNDLPLKRRLRHDIPASVVVFLVAVPLCLGIALASGAPLLSGLIAGVVGGIIVGIASGSPLGVSGPAAGLAVIVLNAITELGSFEIFLTAVIIAGVLQILLGLLQAGVVAYYFPAAVIKGMLSGIGIIIILKQIPHAMGYDTDPIGDMHFDQPDEHTTFSQLYHMLDHISTGPLIVAVVSLAILLIWERPFVKRNKILNLVPGPLLAVIVGILLGMLFAGMEGMRMGRAFFVNLPDLYDADVLATLPRPDFGVLGDMKVWTVAFTIAIVASIETLLCVEATDKMDPHKRITPSNRELVAQGIGNSISGFLGGLPITQVIVRSSANIQSGGLTKLSAILHGFLILFSVILIPHILRMIPLASLAAILLVVGYKLAKPVLFTAMWKRGWHQFVPFMVTVLGVVLTDLLTGVALGMAVGIFIILYNNYKIPFHFDPRSHRKGEPIRITLSEDVSFLNKASILRTLSTLPEGAHVIIDASETVRLDDDVVEIIEEEKARASERNITLELIGFDPGGISSDPKEVQRAIMSAASGEDLSWSGSQHAGRQPPPVDPSTGTQKPIRRS